MLSHGDIQKAIEDTVEITMSSHDDPYSVSGACAIAAAVSEAIKEKTDLYKIVQAAYHGSIQGEKLARKRKDIWIYPGPSVTKRIEMAIQISLHCGSQENVVQELAERIGSGPAVAETVPVAIGILIANQGNTMESIYDAVNIGDETSAIACITGAIAGAYHGVGSIKEGYTRYLRVEKIKWILSLRRKGLKNCGKLLHRICPFGTRNSGHYRERIIGALANRSQWKNCLDGKRGITYWQD